MSDFWTNNFPAPCKLRFVQEEPGGLTDIEDGHEESLLGTDIMELVHVPVVFSKYRFDTYYKKELPIDSFKNTVGSYLKRRHQ